MKDLTTLATTINEHHEQAQAHAKTAIEHALACGDALLTAKKTVKHGEWLDWLKANTIISERTASGYMRVASNRDAIEGKQQRVTDLSLRGALQALSKPRPLHRIYEIATDEQRDRLDVMVSSRMNCPDELKGDALLDFYADSADLAVRYMDWSIETAMYRKENPDNDEKHLMLTRGILPEKDEDGFGRSAHNKLEIVDQGKAWIQIAREAWFGSALPALVKYGYSPNKMTANGIFLMHGQMMIIRALMIDDGWADYRAD